MTPKIAFLFLIGAAAISVTGCTSPLSGERSQASTPSLAEPPGGLHKSNNFASLIYLAAQTLADRAEGLDKARPIVVTTIVSVDNLDNSSTFGRLASEMIANRIQQRGYLVREVTYTRLLAMNKEGVLALSRDASHVLRPINSQAVVAGTYAVAGEMIYLSLRLISADSGEVISSADVAIPRDENTDPLIETNGGAMFLDKFEAQRTVSDN